jgi:hypothetical protein
MVIVILNVLIGCALAYGAAQEAVVGGILGGDRVGLIVGCIGTVSSLLLVFSGVASWRQWRRSRELTLVACGLLAAFSIWAALPPLRFLGVFALLLGAGYPAVVATYLFRGPGRGAAAGEAPRSSPSPDSHTGGLSRVNGAA